MFQAKQDLTSDGEPSATKPSMVCATKLGNYINGWCILYLDRKYLEVEETAFDLLFKPHFVFNVQ